MSEPLIHLEEIQQELEQLHTHGHTSEDPILYKQVVLMELALNRALREMKIFKTGD